MSKRRFREYFHRTIKLNPELKEPLNDFLANITLPNHDLTKTQSFEDLLTHIFKDCDDVHFRKIELSPTQTLLLVYIKGLVDEQAIEKMIVRPIFDREDAEKKDHYSETLTSLSPKKYQDLETLVQGALTGDVIIHLDGDKPVQVSLNGMETRSLSPPLTEQQVYGAKVGFIEDSKSNIALMRQYFPDPRLKVKNYNIGTLSHTHVGLLYLDDYADENLLDEVQNKLASIKVEKIFSSRELAEQVIERPNSLFPQVQKTERVDQVAYALTQGRIALMVNNTPFCNVLPIGLTTFYETAEDNDEGTTWSMMFIRFLRYVCLIISTLLPALYVSLVAFHPELIPTTLAMTLAESRNNIPLPAGLEALLMMFALDVLVEASIRLPSFIGQTVGIVGGLVIGQAAVTAGVVSSAMVIVIAFTAIASFTVPSWELATSLRLVRYLLLFVSVFFGLYGLTLGVCLIFIHLSSLESFSKPYLDPIAPFNFKGLKAMFFKRIPGSKGEKT
ncbi:spore germination protein [Halalkalibacter urbisdiaboli]|uniref:spore germination protein n=1 Tax=Halalkalibacter urbisdiaboli TaxID=1960589 RepID=UPI000B44BD1D|nr:spore germination protein [Halalkalibacter urbisdiaboli]